MISYFLFFFALVFDVKGAEEGGNAFQLIAFFLTIATAFHIIYIDKNNVAVGRQHKLVGLLLIIHIVCTFAVELIQGVEFGRYIRITLPYLFLILGYFVGIRSFSKFGVEKTVHLLTGASLVSTVFTIFYGLSTGDFSENGIRFQVLSPMLFILVPVLAYTIFVAKKMITTAVFLMIAIFLLILISATRSWLITYVLVVLLALSVSKFKSFIGLVKGIFRGAIYGALIAIVTFPVLYLLIPEVITRFGQRFFGSEVLGFDITTATRIAEMDYQINGWLTDIPSFLMGKGLGATYGFSGPAADQLADLFVNNADIVDPEWWFAGHNIWVYSLYTQGILFGLVIPLLLLLASYLTFRNILKARKNYSTKKVDSDISYMMMCFLIFSSIIFSTVGGNPMGNRMLAEYIGVFLSLVFALNSRKRIKKNIIS